MNKEINANVEKSGALGSLVVNDEMLAKINKQTLSPLTAEDVFVYKIKMSDNTLDVEKTLFAAATIEKMADLFIGTTMIKDHEHRSDNQIARIFDTELVKDDKQFNTLGEPVVSLIAHAYIIKTPENESFIREISGGIRREVSVGVAVKTVECSTCGVNKMTTYCDHWTWQQKDEPTYYIYKDAEYARELSFVVSPANRNAGVIKSLVDEKPEDLVDKSDESSSLALRLRVQNSKNFIRKQSKWED